MCFSKSDFASSYFNVSDFIGLTYCSSRCGCELFNGVKSILIKGRRKVKLIILFKKRENLKGEHRKQKEQKEQRESSVVGIKLFRRLERNLRLRLKKRTTSLGRLAQKKKKKNRHVTSGTRLAAII